MILVHRDLKPQNILLSLNEKGQTVALISDFGLCKMVSLTKYLYSTQHILIRLGKIQSSIDFQSKWFDRDRLVLDWTSNSSLKSKINTIIADGWIAPEVMKNDFNSLTFAVDVFSLGCIFYYVISNGLHPFGESLSRQDNIRRDNYNLEYLDTISELLFTQKTLLTLNWGLEDYVAKNAIENMIVHDPTRRPPSHAVQNHLCSFLFFSRTGITLGQPKLSGGIGPVNKHSRSTNSNLTLV